MFPHTPSAYLPLPASSGITRYTTVVSRKALLDFRDLSFRRHAAPFCALASSRGMAVSSGRAAIFHALRMLGVRSGDAVLVPTYHCPTLVAPVIALGAQPLFYPLIAPGVPDTTRITIEAANSARAIIVPQLFGLPVDLAHVREWCDRNGIPMVEDCAHTLFGRAGDALAGQWGDFATASLTKFLPVSELGWLFSHRRQFEPATLLRSSIRRQIKGFLDPAQVAAEHKRLGWAGIAVRAIVRSTSKRRHTDRAAAFSLPGDAKLDPDPDRLLRECDLSRIEHAPAVGSRLIARLSDWAMIAERRRNNFRRIARMARETGIGRPLRDDPPYTSCPYVLPLLVDEPEILYPAVRRTGVPVYRWDRQWPGTEQYEGDLAAEWRYRLLQIPVHQSYSDQDFEWLARQLQQLSALAVKTRS